MRFRSRFTKRSGSWGPDVKGWAGATALALGFCASLVGPATPAFAQDPGGDGEVSAFSNTVGGLVATVPPWGLLAIGNGGSVAMAPLFPGLGLGQLLEDRYMDTGWI